MCTHAPCIFYVGLRPGGLCLDTPRALVQNARPRRAGRAVECTSLDNTPACGLVAVETNLQVMSEPQLATVSSNRNFRRAGRAVECTSLENWQGFAPFVSSNLTPSAKAKF